MTSRLPTKAYLRLNHVSTPPPPDNIFFIIIEAPSVGAVSYQGPLESLDAVVPVIRGLIRQLSGPGSVAYFDELIDSSESDLHPLARFVHIDVPLQSGERGLISLHQETNAEVAASLPGPTYLVVCFDVAPSTFDITGIKVVQTFLSREAASEAASKHLDQKLVGGSEGRRSVLRKLDGENAFKGHTEEKGWIVEVMAETGVVPMVSSDHAQEQQAPITDATIFYIYTQTVQIADFTSIGPFKSLDELTQTVVSKIRHDSACLQAFQDLYNDGSIVLMESLQAKLPNGHTIRISLQKEENAKVKAALPGVTYRVTLAELAHEDACRNCGKTQTSTIQLMKCSKCKAAKYCTPNCQKAHWSIHKRKCGKKDPEQKSLSVVGTFLSVEEANTYANVTLAKVLSSKQDAKSSISRDGQKGDGTIMLVGTALGELWVVESVMDRGVLVDPGLSQVE